MGSVRVNTTSMDYLVGASLGSNFSQAYLLIQNVAAVTVVLLRSA